MVSVSRREQRLEDSPERKRGKWGGREIDPLLDEMKRAQSELENTLLKISRHYSRLDEPEVAAKYMERLVRVTEDSEKKAFCLLSLGQLMEQCGEYETALGHYKQALLLEPGNECSWYFIHNNMGCCLNHLEEFEDAERYCRDAILIDPARYNAFINLGVSLEAQERFLEATQSFLSALQADAEDMELIVHIEELVDEHDEIADQIQGIRETLSVYRQSAEDQELRGLTT